MNSLARYLAVVLAVAVLFTTDMKVMAGNTKVQLITASQLKKLFNDSSGSTRVIVLLSPT